MTSTPKTAAKDTDNEWSLVLYLEFASTQSAENHIVQFFIFPETKNPVTGGLIPAHFLSRNISEANPKRAYRVHSIERDAYGPGHINYSLNSKKIIRDASLGEGIGIAKEHIYKVLSNQLDTFIDVNSWKLREEPLVVGVSQREIAAIETESMPRSLYDRIRRTRSALGWPALLGEKVEA